MMKLSMSGIMAPDAALFRLREHEAPPVTNEFFLLVSKDVGVMGDDGEELNRPDDNDDDDDDDDGEDDSAEDDDGGEDSDRLRTVLCNDDGMAIAPGSTLRVSVGELVVPVPVVVAVVAVVAVVPVVEVLRNGVGVVMMSLVIDDSTTTTAVAVNSPVLLLLLLMLLLAIGPFVLIDTNVGLVGDEEDDTVVLLNTFPLLATVVVVASGPPLLLLLLMFSLAQPPPPTITTSFTFRSFLFVLSLVFENQLFSWIMVSPVMALNCSFWACDG